MPISTAVNLFYEQFRRDHYGYVMVTYYASYFFLFLVAATLFPLLHFNQIPLYEFWISIKKFFR